MRSGEWAHLVHYTAKHLYQFDILAFVIAADIVGLPHPTFSYYRIERFGVIFDVEPVADVFTFAVDGNRLAAQAF